MIFGAIAIRILAVYLFDQFVIKIVATTASSADGVSRSLKEPYLK
jgi:hypothetical protein